MNVRELIEKLSRVDPELPVAISVNEEFFLEGNEIFLSYFTSHDRKAYLLLGDEEKDLHYAR